MQLMFAPPVKAFPQPAILATRRAQRFESSLLSPRVSSARLSLIARPDRETAVRMAALAARLRMERGLSGQPLPAEQFHVRLFQADEISGRAPGLLSERIEAARERAASVSMPSFRVAFDRAGSFDNGACGLHGEAGTMGLEVLHQRLEDAFDGTPRPARAFTPSITLLRDSRRMEDEFIEPIHWQVCEMVLVQSTPGRSENQELARFALN